MGIFGCLLLQGVICNGCAQDFGDGITTALCGISCWPTYNALILHTTLCKYIRTVLRTHHHQPFIRYKRIHVLVFILLAISRNILCEEKNNKLKLIHLPLIISVKKWLIWQKKKPGAAAIITNVTAGRETEAIYSQ